MLLGLISGLIVAWLVSIFGGDLLIIQGVFELTGKQISIAGYYTIFALVGLIMDLLRIVPKYPVKYLSLNFFHSHILLEKK